MNAMAELAGSFGPTNDPFQASIITREAMQEIILYAIDKAGFSDNVSSMEEPAFASYTDWIDSPRI